MPGHFAGVILAGGRSMRMGGRDKALLPLGGQPLVVRALAKLGPQVDTVAINANDDPARFGGMAAPVLTDTVPGFPGPLAGILAGMEWAAGIPVITHLATAAVDTPLFPTDLVSRLAEALGEDGGTVALARSRGRRHPVFGLWPIALRDDLSAFLADGGAKVSDFADRHGAVAVDFPDMPARAGPVDPFFNVNEPRDLDLAESLAAEFAS